jgi:hypothetical protein
MGVPALGNAGLECFDQVCPVSKCQPLCCLEVPVFYITKIWIMKLVIIFVVEFV